MVGKKDLHYACGGYVISMLKLSGWPTNLVFSQLKEYPISLNCYNDIYP